MIPIQKKAEPVGLTHLRQKAVDASLSPKAAYDKLRNPLKKQVRDSLVEEQGQLCAYCMCKIPRTDADLQITPIIIEHITPRDPVDGLDAGQGLDYYNFVAVCHGNKGPHGTRTIADLTCDAHKANVEFRKINPCKSETLASIFYSLDGKIDASDSDVHFDLVSILNLNCVSSPLIAERKAVLDSLITEIGSKTDDNILPYCTSTLDAFRAETNPKTPYVGILIWYLQTMIAALSAT